MVILVLERLSIVGAGLSGYELSGCSPNPNYMEPDKKTVLCKRFFQNIDSKQDKHDIRNQHS